MGHNMNNSNTKLSELLLNRPAHLAAVSAAALFGLVALAGCDGGAEDAGEEVDDAVEEVGDEVEDLTDG